MSQESGRQVSVLLQRALIVFWDFDGVIKDSVGVKSVGFEQLFIRYGRKIADRVRRHHEAHGGISRYEKMPLYLSWAGERGDPIQIRDFCERFSQLVRQAVIDAAWVPGVREYLEAHHARQHFVLMTGTPQEEIQQILHKLVLSHCFREVHGARMPKAKVIRDLLRRWQCAPEQVVVVGDSETDLEAAQENNVGFILRRTPWNQSLQKQFQGSSFEYL